ncbi:MAG: hypothetical protein Q4E88_06025 [Coriobacteriia bacterium]|nr:hypothetical protein [Coriobacteriia bacterium]
MTNLKENTMIKKLTVILAAIAIAIAAYIVFSPNQAHADIDPMPLIVVDTSTTYCETPSLGIRVYTDSTSSQSNLSPESIEEMDILHDSTSSAIYGC